MSRVLLDTSKGKYLFEVESKDGQRDEFTVSEDLVDELLETGAESLELQIGRILDFALPDSWAVRAS